MNSMNTEPKYNMIIGGIIIPDDRETFNKMWLNKDFDQINPALLIRNHPPLLHRQTNGLNIWENTLFDRRQDLQYMSASQMWEQNIYYAYLIQEIANIIWMYDPLSDGNILSGVTWLPDIPLYLSQQPDLLMSPRTNLPLIYTHPQLRIIYRDQIVRFQLIANKTNNERISLYMDEIFDLSKKIQFIQMLSYYDIKIVIRRFKQYKNNYLIDDPDIRDIKQEANEFSDISYIESIYKFYIFCVSPEKMSPEITNKALFLGEIVINYDGIRRLVTDYLLPMKSSLKQDMLKTDCCEIIFSYLKPTCISEQYVKTKLNK